MKSERLCLLLFTLIVSNAKAVLYTEHSSCQQSDGFVLNAAQLEGFGLSDNVDRLKEGFDCLARASRESVTNELGWKDAGVVQLLNRAESFFSEAVGTPRMEVAARAGLASVHEARGDREKALLCVDEGLVKYPTNVPLLCRRGWLLKINGRIDESIATYRKAVSCGSVSPSPWLDLALVLIQTKQFDEAVTVCREALHRWPDDEIVADYSLKSLLCASRWDEAKTQCVSLMDAHPLWTRLLYRRGQIQANTGSLEKAIKDFEEVAKLNPHSCDAFNEMGWAWTQLNEFQKAQECYQEGLLVHPWCVEICHNLSVCYMRQKEYDKAIELLRFTQRLSPSNVNIADSMAAAYLGKGDAATAFRVCTNALAGQAWAWNLSFRACVCLRALGRREDALMYAEKGISVAQQEPEAWCTYARLLSDFNLQGKAAEAFGKAARLNPHEALYLSCRAQALYFAGRTGESVAACREAQSRFPNELTFLPVMIEGLDRLGKKEEAIACRKQIEASNPLTKREREYIEESWGAIGRVYFRSERYNEAKDAYANAWRFSETNVFWIAAQIESEAMVDRAGAKRQLADAVIRFNDDPELLALWAQIAILSQHPQEREEALKALLPKGTASSKTLYWCGLINKSLGRTAQAVTNWMAAIKLNPNYAEPYDQIGQANEQLKEDPHKSLSWTKKAVELAPNNAEFRSNLGYYYYLCGAHTNAVRELEGAVAMKPTLGIAWYNLALARIALGQHDRAFADAEKAKQVGYPANFDILKRQETFWKTKAK